MVVYSVELAAQLFSFHLLHKSTSEALANIRNIGFILYLTLQGLSHAAGSETLSLVKTSGSFKRIFGRYRKALVLFVLYRSVTQKGLTDGGLVIGPSSRIISDTRLSALSHRLMRCLPREFSLALVRRVPKHKS